MVLTCLDFRTTVSLKETGASGSLSCPFKDGAATGRGAEVRHWLGKLGVKTLFIEPGSPWENGYCESFNSKLRDELLNGEIFTTLCEAQVLIERSKPPPTVLLCPLIRLPPAHSNACVAPGHTQSSK